MARAASRISGPPRSPNGASSFHLWWELPPCGPLVEVSAVLEVVEPPAVDSLYFWALQVDFLDGARHLGGGHTGLQWNLRYLGGTAVNWGGYASQRVGGFVLPGTASSLPGFADDPHTRSYPWQAGRPYRLRIQRSPDHADAWRAEVTDQEAGRVTVVRDLIVGDLVTGGRSADPSWSRETTDRGAPFGDNPTRLGFPVMWSEVFADCDAPSVVVRWSNLRALDENGVGVTPAAVRINYQRYEDGGCTNTTVAATEGGLLQVTNAARIVPQGAVVRL